MWPTDDIYAAVIGYGSSVVSKDCTQTMNGYEQRAYFPVDSTTEQADLVCFDHGHTVAAQLR